MAKNYKCELRKESLEIRVEFEDLDAEYKQEESDSSGSESDSGSDASSYYKSYNKTVLKKSFCVVVGNTEYQLSFQLTNLYDSDNLKIEFGLTNQHVTVTNLRIEELFLKVQGEKNEFSSDSEDELIQSSYEKIGTLHTKEFTNVIQSNESWLNNKTWQCTLENQELKGFKWTEDKISGWFVFSFETTKPLQNFRDFNAKTMKHFSILKPPMGNFDCDIIADGKHFMFHKSYLGQLSEVFQKMFEHSGTVEHQTGKVNCKGFSKKTVKKFHNLLYKQNLIKEDITTELMKFADKYMINTLYSFCLEHFRDHVTEPNLIELIKMGTFKNDDLLLKCCAEYIRTTHKRQFFKTKEWTTFTAKNPECTTKIMNSMS